MNKTKKIIIAVISVILILTIGGFLLIKNQTTNNPKQPAKQENQLTDKSKKVTKVISFFEKELVWKKENNPDFEKGKEIKFKEDLELQQGTIEMWLKPKRSNAGEYQKIITSSNNSIELGFQPDGDLYFYPAQAGTQNYNLIKKPIDNNELAHITITWDFKTKKVQFYINGQKQKNDIENIPTNWKENLQLGKSWYILGETNGSIQDLKIHSNVLSDKDIRLKYTKNALKKNVLDYTVKDSVIFYKSRKLDDVDYESFEYLGSDYAKDKNNVYYKNRKIKDADLKTFKYLGGGYAKDQNNVYYFDDILEGVDSKTFEYLGGLYSKDKKNIYYVYVNYVSSVYVRMLPYTKVNIQSFEYIGDGYAKDINRLYKDGMILKNINQKTFKYFGNGYFKDGGNIYYNKKIVKNADSKTFKYLDDDYAKDKNNVYSSGWIMKNADPKTFENVDGFIKNTDPKVFESVSRVYFKDKSNVYYEGEIFKNADPKTFKCMDKNCNYVKDKNNVYYEDEIVKNADPKTFEYLGGYYVKDKKSVYCWGKKIEGADPQTFSFIEWYYAKDKNNVYYEDEIVKNADPKTFEYLGSYYCKDKNHIYHDNEVVKDADLKTFKYLSNGYIKDKNNVYYDGEILENVNPQAFEYFKDGYFKDKNNVYYDGKILENSDISSFVALKYNCAKDNHNIYYYDVVLEHDSLVDIETFECISSKLAKDKKYLYSIDYERSSINMLNLANPQHCLENNKECLQLNTFAKREDIQPLIPKNARIIDKMDNIDLNKDGINDLVFIATNYINEWIIVALQDKNGKYKFHQRSRVFFLSDYGLLDLKFNRNNGNVEIYISIPGNGHHYRRYIFTYQKDGYYLAKIERNGNFGHSHIYSEKYDFIRKHAEFWVNNKKKEYKMKNYHQSIEEFEYKISDNSVVGIDNELLVETPEL